MIRAALEEPGHTFWDRKSDPVAPSGRACEEPVFDGEGLPLSFLRFATPEDGEDLKAEFKKRLGEAEAQLEAEEVDEVVREAVCIFENMMLVVGQLDGVCSGEEEKKETEVDEGWVAQVTGFFGGRVRDSLAVARERGLRPFSGGKKEKKVKGEDVLDLKREKSGVAGVAETAVVDVLSSSLLSPSVVLVEKEGSDVGQAAEAKPLPSPVLKAVRFEEEPPVADATNDEGGASDVRSMIQNASPVLSTAVLIGLVGVVWGLGQMGW